MRKNRVKGADVVAADDPAVQRHIRAIVMEAERGVEAAFAVMRAFGFDTAEGETRSFPLELALKFAAMMRIYEWQEADLIKFFELKLPTVELLLHDLPRAGRADEKYPGDAIAFDVFRVWRRQMALQPMVGGQDVVVARIDSDAVVAQLAEFLWRHRRLGHMNQENKN